MRLIVLVIVLAWQFNGLHAQPWRDLLPKDKPSSALTFYDYQQAFYTYWAPFHVEEGYYIENGEKKKATGYKQFKRWEHWTKYKINKATGEFPKRSALDIVREHEQRFPSSRSLVSNWKSIGPATAEGGYSGIGRINCVAFHPTDTLTLWAGAASGGLWVSHDQGTTWQCLTDLNESLGVSDVVIAPDYDFSKTIYIATGDRDAIDNMSVGVLKSTDGGASWNETGLHYELAEFNLVNRLIMHPQDPMVLIAATRDGVYKTTDGGLHWDTALSPEEFIDMEFHPADPTIIYGSTWDGEVFRSINGGDTWSRTLFAFEAGRTEMAVTPAAPNIVYAVGSTGGLEGIYRSLDHGASFEKILDGDTMNILHWDAAATASGGQGWYDLAIAASPVDPDVLFVGGINTWRSVDGGLSWKIVTHLAGGQGIPSTHADKHNIRFNTNGDVWECNDGGIYVSTDNGVSWSDKSNGMAISQIYRIAVSPTNPNEVLIGLQDNGSKLYSEGVWTDVGGGDGMDCMIHPLNHNIQFTSSQYGNLFRTLDHYASSRYIKPQLAGSGAWLTPYMIDPADPNTLYGGFKEVWKSTDLGDTWTQVSSINAGQKLEVMAIAPSDNQIVFVAESGRMWKSETGGEPFVRLTGNDPGNTNQISYIAIKHDDPQTLWVSCAGFWEPAVFQSSDGGLSWENISAGLPLIPVYCVTQNVQSVDTLELYAGTELGVYVKRGDRPWAPFSTNLPNVIVSELEFHYSPDPAQTLLRASTYGRGVWETRVRFNSSPMMHVSTMAKHPSLASINPGLTNQEILKIEMVTSGDLEPLHATSFAFSTEGSDQVSQTITNARLYYSADINTFLTTTPFGEMISSPDGEFIIEGDQPLQSGNNFFWLAYDISQDAEIGSRVDAACFSIQTNQTVIPAIPAPEGSRFIALTYCDAGSTLTSGEHISHVVSSEIDQASQKGAGGYEDYTSHIIPLEIGVPKVLSVTNSSPHQSNEMLAWVDWNRDGDFDDIGERQYDSGPSGISTYQVTILAPEHAKTGQTRMRIRLHDINFGPNDEPCGTSNLGEVEDYTVDVREVMTSTDNNIPARSLTILPNPANAEITIMTGLPVMSLEIINSVGSRVYQANYPGTLHVDVTHLAPDLYVIRLVSGTTVYIGRFIRH